MACMAGLLQARRPVRLRALGERARAVPRESPAAGRADRRENTNVQVPPEARPLQQRRPVQLRALGGGARAAPRLHPVEGSAECIPDLFLATFRGMPTANAES